MIKLRKYQPKDWNAIAAIHDRARLDELSASVGIEAFLSLADTAENEGLFDGEVWVACDEEIVLGFVAFSDDEVTWLYVSPEHYRQGIGRQLLKKAIAQCQACLIAKWGKIVHTSVLSGNDIALNLYLSEGFKIVETKTGKLDGNESFSATGHILQLDQKLFSVS
ncbi:Acetyltransferase, GNAT family [Hyella patelloides LEGE 07179]|uniref:Acetyltransferase, GNAT family n=1 Tax=Hyella patelloides LEGE 07179 TaxID=945734 RepID=A0A563VU21_9CYAN|nr:GNAT family N-acetyltransferase [Hyella patelloides]VEP14908.1 Acetyltransferase, GNAT family [Hyella patelloides LEGE 07179]